VSRLTFRRKQRYLEVMSKRLLNYEFTTHRNFHEHELKAKKGMKNVWQFEGENWNIRCFFAA